jgi:hypothetical protein
MSCEDLHRFFIVVFSKLGIVFVDVVQRLHIGVSFFKLLRAHGHLGIFLLTLVLIRLSFTLIISSFILWQRSKIERWNNIRLRWNLHKLSCQGFITFI